MTGEETRRGEPIRPGSSPPGEFVSDDLRTQTARFLDEVRRRLRRTRREEGPRLGPPGKGR